MIDVGALVEEDGEQQRDEHRKDRPLDDREDGERGVAKADLAPKTLFASGPVRMSAKSAAASPIMRKAVRTTWRGRVFQNGRVSGTS